MRRSLNRRSNVFLALTISLIILLPGLNYYLNNIALQSGKTLVPISVLLYGLLIVLELISIGIVISKGVINRAALIVSITGVFLTFLSYALFNNTIGTTLITPDFNPMYSEAIYFVLFCLPALVICSSISDWNYVFKPLSILSPIVVVTGFYAFYLQGFTTFGEGKMDYMSLSYYILTGSCFCFYYFIDKKRILYGVLALVGLFVVMAAGCRGAIMCYLTFVFLAIYRQISISKSSIKNIALVSVVILLISFFSLSALTNWFDDLGISSRAVDMLNEGTFLEDNSRDNIRKAVWMGIIENPFGYGLFGDRHITAEYYAYGVEYSHNIIYELLADFGFLGFTLILFFLFSGTVKFYKKFKNDLVWVVFLLMVPEGLLELLFSGSYLLDVKTWILLALLLNRKKILFINQERNVG